MSAKFIRVLVKELRSVCVGHWAIFIKDAQKQLTLNYANRGVQRKWRDDSHKGGVEFIGQSRSPNKTCRLPGPSCSIAAAKCPVRLPDSLENEASERWNGGWRKMTIGNAVFFCVCLEFDGKLAVFCGLYGAFCGLYGVVSRLYGVVGRLYGAFRGLHLVVCVRLAAFCGRQTVFARRPAAFCGPLTPFR